MIDKYKLLNNEQIDFNKYSIEKTNNSSMKNIMSKKIHSNKNNSNKTLIASIFIIFLLTSVFFNSDITWAYFNRLVNSIEYFLDRDSGEFNKYKFEGNQSIEHNGLIINLGDVMLDDRQLIISVSIDYSKFDFKKYGFNKKDFIPSIPIIKIGTMSFPTQAGFINQRTIKGQNKKEILYKVDLTQIDTNFDGLSDSDFEILDNLEKNKQYPIKIQFKEFDIGASKTEPGRWLTKEFGKWEFNTILENTNISNDIKIINLNKIITFTDDTANYKLIIDNIRISPISVKIKLETEKKQFTKSSVFSLKVTDQNNNNLFTRGNANYNSRGMYEEYELNGTERKIIITPIVYSTNTKKYIELKHEKLEIDIPKN